jgi:hypothetical protein
MAEKLSEAFQLLVQQFNAAAAYRPRRSEVECETVAELQHVRLTMHRETNHARPHFHLRFKTQYSVSYALDTFECLAGAMPKKYTRKLLKWAKENVQQLLAKWNELNEREQFVLTTEGHPMNHAVIETDQTRTIY